MKDVGPFLVEKNINPYENFEVFNHAPGMVYFIYNDVTGKTFQIYVDISP